MNDKIIAAPVTAPGISGVSMIRISGKSCIEIVDSIFRGSNSLSEKKGYEIIYGVIIDPETHKTLDQVLISIFHSPHSFTGEESLEICTHGSPYIVNEFMRVLTSLGISIAEPGEFTMRAFLNGKIDLTQAEAICDLIESQTKFSHAQAILRLSGVLSNKINVIHDSILNLLALLEVGIDHNEEEFDVQDLSSQYTKMIENLQQEIAILLSGAKVGKMSANGVKVVLIGRPNVGKSSLLNALVGENRVIVSDIEGTTRDVIEHRILKKGLLVRFFDTAGLRKTDDPIEKEGTERTLKAIQDSDLIFYVVDNSAPFQKEDADIVNFLSTIDKTILVLQNKKDLKSQLELSLSYKIIHISSFCEEDIDLIYQEIQHFYFSGGVDPESDVLIANIRQENLLFETQKCLQKAYQSLNSKESEEFIAAHVRQARILIEEIVGKTTNDTILDRIFSQFCIGK